MRPNAIIIELKKYNKKKASTQSIFLRIINTIVTEIRMRNFYIVWKWNHFIGHQLQVNIEFLKKINELAFNFNLRYFCFSVN